MNSMNSNLDPRLIKSAQSSGASKISFPLGTLIGFLALCLYIVSPTLSQFPSVLAGIFAFALTQVIWPESRIQIAVPFLPSNIAQILFAMQLFVLPMLAAFTSLSQGALPRMPSNKAINISLLITTVAYVAYSAAFHYFSKRFKMKAMSSTVNGNRQLPVLWSKPLVWIFLVIGLIGFFLYYDTVAGYISYIVDPLYWTARNLDLSGTLRGGAATFLRPFLPASILLAWSIWLVTKPRSKKTSTLVTLIACVLLIVMNFSYNRGTVLAPLLAIVVAYSLSVQRIPVKLIAVAGALFIVPVFVFGTYRSQSRTAVDLLAPDQVSTLVARTDLGSSIQVYGAAPQFQAFLLEQTNYGDPLYLGQTLISSLLYPIPVIGKTFRPTSGVVLYNQLIYNDPTHIDQVVPFQGELFINFHLIGVIFGFIAVGGCLAWLQRKILVNGNPFETAAWFLMALWTLFLISGSLAVTSQLYVFFFWPFYVYFGIKQFRAQRAPRNLNNHR